jgi:hypothetical protein
MRHGAFVVTSIIGTSPESATREKSFDFLTWIKISVALQAYIAIGTVCLTRPACAKRPGTGSNLWVALPDPLPGRSASAEGPCRNGGINRMTAGEVAYMTMVLVLFFAFIAVIGTISQTQTKRRD